MKTLSTVLLALQQDLGGRHDLALDQLATSQADLEKQPAATRAGSGMDLVYYLLAVEKLFLRRYAEAAQDAEQAVNINEAQRARLRRIGAARCCNRACVQILKSPCRRPT